MTMRGPCRTAGDRGPGKAGAAPGPAAGRCGEVPPARRSRDATGELRHDCGHETAPTWAPRVAIHAGLDAVARGDAQRPRHTDGPRPRTVHRSGGPAAASSSPDVGRARPTSVPSIVSSGKHWVVPALHKLKLDRGSRAGRQDERGCTGPDGTVGWFLHGQPVGAVDEEASAPPPSMSMASSGPTEVFGSNASLT